MKRATSLNNSITFLGAPILRLLTEDEKKESETLLTCALLPNACFYFKAIISGQLYHSSAYMATRKMRRNNCTVLLNNGNIVQILAFCIVSTFAELPRNIVFCSRFDISPLPYAVQLPLDKMAAGHIRMATPGDGRHIVAVDVISIVQKCIITLEDEACFVCIMPN